MTAQNCVHLHARVVVPKHEFSIVDQRKIALVNELRNFRTVTSMGMVKMTTPKSDAQKWATVSTERKIAFTFKNNQFLKKWELQRFLHVNIIHAQR